MKTEHFVIPLADLEYGPKTVGWDLSPEWLARALEGTEATPRGAPGRLEATLTKSGRKVVVRGSVAAPLTMPCARSLEPVEIDVKADLFLMLGPDAAALQQPAAARRGRSRHRPEPEGDLELLSDEAAAEDTHPHDRIVLDGFAREYLVLELPMFPLRSEDSATISLASPPEGATGVPTVDPRLAPLAALKARLEQKVK